MMGPTENNSTPKRPRYSWFLSVNKVEGIAELSIGYKNSKGEVAPFSRSKAGANVKIPWGPPVKCEYLVKRDGEEVFGEYTFTNRRKDEFKVTDGYFYSFAGGINPFSQRISSMIVDKREVLLALYLSLMPYTVGFAHHREEVHSVDGFLLDGSGLNKDDVVKKGGSMEEFGDFVRTALESAVTVNPTVTGAADISTFFEKNKRKSQESSSKPAKKSNAATVDENEKLELTDKDGLEKEYQKSLVGMANIPLENISISTDLKVNINMFRVYRIIASMENRYDPSISIPVVCPENDQTVLDLTNVKNQKFVVVQKIHTIKAFQEMNKEGKFSQLASHNNNTVLCYVLGTSSAGLIYYGNLRANEIQNQFTRKTSPQDLLRIHHTLSSKDNSSNSLKAIERMARLSRIGPNECTALSKLCSWSTVALTALIQVISQYERYETLDVKPSGHKTHLARGEKMNMSNVLFKMLGKLDENYFLSEHNKILVNECSLKACVENFKTVKEVEKVSAALSIVAGHTSFESIKKNHPGKFDFDQLKQFIGAEVKSDGEKNLTAKMLEKYYLAHEVGDCEASKNFVTFVEYDDIENLMSERNTFDEFETIIFQMGKENQNLAFKIVNSCLCSKKDFNVTLMTFPAESLQFEVLSFLRKNQSRDEGFKVVPLLFHGKAVTSEDVAENVKFGVLFGRFSVLSPPLNIYHSCISNLLNIVEKISPPSTTVAVISYMNVPLVQVHSQTLTKKVTYFGSSTDIIKFKASLQKRSTTPVSDVENKSVSFLEDNAMDLNRRSTTVSDISSLDVNQSTTSPFKRPESSSSKSQTKPRNLSKGYRENLDSIGEEVDEDIYEFEKP